MAAFGSNDSCPNCGTAMAADQRYCLNCGHRRGDPRLPFMDAVVFMESQGSAGGPGKTTPPPPPASSGGGSNKWNANAALIAGVATLVLAVGVGFLIGRTGHENNNTQAQAPQIIKVEGGGGGGGGTEEASTETTETESTSEGSGKEASSGKSGKSGGKGGKKKAAEIEENSKEELEAAEEASAEVLHPKGKQAKAGTQVGESCEKGSPGCEGEEFTGNFFGE